MARCVETRTTADGHRRRRYETATGARYSTIEVPLEVWRRVVTAGRQRDRAVQATRALERERVKHQARLLHAAGRRPREIAAGLGVPLRTVQRWVA